MQIHRRLVVTGHNQKGESIFASDTVIDGTPIPGMPGFETVAMWGADHRMQYPDKGAKPAYTNYFPTKAGFRVIETYLPAKAELNEDNSVHGSAAAQMQSALPGLAETMEKDRPGMHRTASVDMVYIIEGRCVLALDSGETMTLSAGDCRRLPVSTFT